MEDFDRGLRETSREGLEMVGGEIERDDAGDLKEEARDNEQRVAAQVHAEVLVGGGLQKSS